MGVGGIWIIRICPITEMTFGIGYNHLTLPGYLDIYCIIGFKEGIMKAASSKSRNNRTRLADAVSRGGDYHLAIGVGVWVGAAACLSGSVTVEHRRTS
jgi:hypothetical protein